MRIKETKVYQFDELDDQAKDKAREWYRGAGLDYEWWDTTYEDAETVGLKITSFDLQGLAEGEFKGTPLETIEKIKANHGETCETYKTALRYEKPLRDALAHFDESLDAENEYENTAHEFKYDLLEDYRILLEQELEYLYSDESVDENIRANEYEFTVDGKRA
jgi:hypothetical protein